MRSTGAEIGLRGTLPWVRSTLTVWGIDLDSELVYVGDAGRVEPSSASRRLGVSFANYLNLTPQVKADVDVSFTRARFRDEVDDRIPGALEHVVAAGLTRDPVDDGWHASLRLRHLGAYPLIEDNSVRAESTTLLNLGFGYQVGALRLSAAVLNLVDEGASDIQYFYTSRLSGEPSAGVDDLHFHPAEPRQLRVSISWGL